MSTSLVNEIVSIDPATGEVRETLGSPTTAQEVRSLAKTAEQAAPLLEALGRTGRAALLRAVAEQLESRREELVALGTRETALPAQRLHGELTRTVYQAEFFAQVLEEGSYLEATIDHAQNTPMGPGPDLRRMLVPIGPVAVFGASNFPLAFSVPGGDTVSALAAGCPVIIKAHSSHPALSRLCFEALTAAITEVGAPEGTVSIAYGTAAGAELVGRTEVKAVGFTGSLSGGEALLALIADRPDPIPFYGELASLNPVIVTDSAAAARAVEIAEGFATAVTASGGQLCTKPGLICVPSGPAGDQLVGEIAKQISALGSIALLNSRIAESFVSASSNLADDPASKVIAVGATTKEQGSYVTPQVTQIHAESLTSCHVEESFGPSGVVVRYEDIDDLGRVSHVLPASLTLSLFGEESDSEVLINLQAQLRDRAGRILYNQFPTGVLVSWAQHHGGPWPSTNTLHTSVGASAIRRFLRPLVWQNAPEEVLPNELRDESPDLNVRRIDSHLVIKPSDKN